MDIESLLPPKREILVFVALFALFFGVYSIPAPGLGRFFATAASAVANEMVSARNEPDAVKRTFRAAHEDPRFDATKRDAAWTMVLEAHVPPTGREARVNINLRKSLYLPMAMFTALALASPIWKGRRGLVVLLGGVGLLLVPVSLWIVVPTMALLYEAMVIDLGPFGQGMIRFIYALIEPPGMIYAIPLLVWGGLLWWTRPRAELVAPSVATSRSIGPQ
jgi:hypothetical protein